MHGLRSWFRWAFAYGRGRGVPSTSRTWVVVAAVVWAWFSPLALGILQLLITVRIILTLTAMRQFLPGPTSSLGHGSTSLPLRRWGPRARIFAAQALLIAGMCALPA